MITKVNRTGLSGLDTVRAIRALIEDLGGHCWLYQGPLLSNPTPWHVRLDGEEKTYSMADFLATFSEER